VRRRKEEPSSEFADDAYDFGRIRQRFDHSYELRLVSVAAVTSRERLELIVTFLIVLIAAVAHFAGVNDVVIFALTAVALAALARAVGTATEQLGARLGSGSAAVVQSALGNLPELFIAIFALRAGLVEVVQAALVGSILANSVLVLGLAFIVGGLRNGVQRFDSGRARIVSTLTLLAAATMAMPSLAHSFHTPAAPHGEALSIVCAVVLLTVFLLTLPAFLRSAEGEEHEAARWSPLVTALVLGLAAAAAAVTPDWFVEALTPAIHTLHMSADFAGLVIVAIAGNAVENVVGVQLAARNRPDFAVNVIVNSSLQVALALTPVLVLVSLLFATHLTLVFPTLLALVLVITAILNALVVNDGESTWQEGVVLVGFYVVIAASFWWGT
jgi:Ca2+:H+ antiporter